MNVRVCRFRHTRFLFFVGLMGLIGIMGLMGLMGAGTDLILKAPRRV